jgi:predicted N-acyltransferase
MPIQTLSRLADLDARQWDALLPDAQPFLRHAFLASWRTAAALARIAAGNRAPPVAQR